jgi:L-alanine-DL-glutamate epimerase-like enolase superfamily enzyme
MMVDQIELERVEIPLAHSVGAGEHRTARRVLLRLRARAAGRIGLGEATPLPGYSLELLGACAAALRAISLPIELDANDPGTIALASASLPAAARAALEGALLDLAGQAIGCPAWALLRKEGAASLALARLMTSDAVAAEADDAIRDGVTTLKRKLRPSALSRELHALEAVRRAHPDVSLRADLNRGVSRAAFAAVAPRLRALGVDFVEEPFTGWLDEQAGDDWPPLALDESIAAPSTTEALDSLARAAPRFHDGRVRAVVVKPMRDGILGGLAIADAARRAGARVVVTHAWEGAIGHLAAIHLAVALGDADEAHGLGAQPVSANGPRAEALRALLRGPRCARPERPGLSS